jgi:hypothetical protein
MCILAAFVTLAAINFIFVSLQSPHVGLTFVLQSVHESLPVVREVSDVTDTTHKCVAAHYVAQGRTGADVSGTYVFKFDNSGSIVEIVAYQDSDEEEYLEA